LFWNFEDVRHTEFLSIFSESNHLYNFSYKCRSGKFEVKTSHSTCRSSRDVIVLATWVVRPDNIVCFYEELVCYQYYFKLQHKAAIHVTFNFLSDCFSLLPYHPGTFSIQQLEYMYSSTRWILLRWYVGEPQGQFGR
jgi:hypothetical protein